jgi:hypothetical protein
MKYTRKTHNKKKRIEIMKIMKTKYMISPVVIRHNLASTSWTKELVSIQGSAFSPNDEATPIPHVKQLSLNNAGL